MVEVACLMLIMVLSLSSIEIFTHPPMSMHVQVVAMDDQQLSALAVKRIPTSQPYSALDLVPLQ